MLFLTCIEELDAEIDGVLEHKLWLLMKVSKGDEVRLSYLRKRCKNGAGAKHRPTPRPSEIQSAGVRSTVVGIPLVDFMMESPIDRCT